MDQSSLSIILNLSIALLAGIIGAIWSGLRTKNKHIIQQEKSKFLMDQIERLQLELTQNKDSYLQEKKMIQDQRDLLNTDNQELIARISIRDTEYRHLLDRLNSQKEETAQLQQQFTKEFENLAHKILEEKTAKFTVQNKENLQNILDPLQEKLRSFEKKVEDTHKESIDHHASLRQQILGLQQVHLQMNQETINLTKALKGDSKTQGNWGEMVLERVLEKSGLEKGREYEVQKSHIKENGSRVLPDVLLHLPDGKKMIVDSKVSLTAYERYVNESDQKLQKLYLNEHILSIRKHIEQLGSKHYWDLYPIQSPDFVLLFIPIETAFAHALNQEGDLYNFAFEKNIVIVTPSTLLATLRTVDSMWKHQKQQENAFEIAKQAGLLYDKFEGLLSDLIRVGKRMEEAQSDYSLAMNKLHQGKGNLLTSIEKLKIMGAKTKKSLPEKLLQPNNSELKE